MEADNVVDLRRHKQAKTVGRYNADVQDIFSGERAFFASGKFPPFAKSYIDSGFKRDLQPTIDVRITFRDARRTAEANQLLAQLRAERFKITSLKPQGPMAEKAIDLPTARQLFAAREQSPYGAYQPSRSGFRSASVDIWDANGVGFTIFVGGYDDRRGEHGTNMRQEHHIIDNDADMQEVAHMFALIQRAKMKLSQ